MSVLGVFSNYIHGINLYSKYYNNVHFKKFQENISSKPLDETLETYLSKQIHYVYDKLLLPFITNENNSKILLDDKLTADQRINMYLAKMIWNLTQNDPLFLGITSMIGFQINIDEESVIPQIVEKIKNIIIIPENASGSDIYNSIVNSIVVALVQGILVIMNFNQFGKVADLFNDMPDDIMSHVNNVFAYVPASRKRKNDDDSTNRSNKKPRK